MSNTLLNMPVSELMHNTGELYHHGVPGMKWGVRKKRVTVGTANAARRSSQSYQNYAQAKAAYKQAKRAERQSPEAKAARAAKAKRALGIGAAVAGTALAAYGAYRLNKWVKSTNAKIAADRGYKHAEKLFMDQQSNALKEIASGRSGLKSISGSVSGSAHATSAARNASRDSFATAARNVINYQRSGGDVRGLRSVGSYLNERDWRYSFGG